MGRYLLIIVNKTKKNENLSSQLNAREWQNNLDSRMHQDQYQFHKVLKYLPSWVLESYYMNIKSNYYSSIGYNYEIKILFYSK